MKLPNDPARVALYARVSTSRQAEHELSIPDQIRQGEVFCERKGWRLVKVFTEPGASATDDKRPVFQEMIDLACGPDRPFDIILTHSFSRFFRDSMLFEIYVRRLAKAGVQVISMTQEVGGDPTSQLIRKVVNLFDEYSSQENAKHVRRSMRENAQQGFWNGSRPPFGYRTEAACQRGDKVKKVLAIDPTEAPVVRLIFDLYLGAGGSPMGIKAIAAHLNERGIMLRGKPFSTGNVHGILTRTTYYGVHFFDRRDSHTFEWKDRAEWVEMKAPVIIDKDTFTRVQATLKARNPKVTPPRVVSGPTLLTGLAKCATCGGGMTLSTGKSGRYRYYACSSCARSGKTACKGRRIPMDVLDNLILDHLADHLFTPERIAAILSAYLDRSAEGVSARREKLRQSRMESTEIEGRKKRLLVLVEIGAMEPNDPSLSERLAQIRLQHQETESRIALLEREVGAGKHRITSEKIAEFAAAMRDRLRNGLPAYRKAYLNLFVDRIEVGDAEIHVRGPKSALARGTVGPIPAITDIVPSFVREWRAREDSNP